MKKPLASISGLLTFLLLCIIVGSPLAAENRLSLAQKINEEKLVLAERFQASVEKCHDHKKKTVKKTCIKRQRELLSTALDHLRDNPREYFREKEKNSEKGGNLDEARKLISAGKGW